MSTHCPLAGQHAIVTGAGRGIGAAIAKRLVAEGARVTLLGRTEADLRKLHAVLGAGTQVTVADVTDADGLHAALEAAAGSFGVATILVNNAGAADSAAFHRAPDALWHDMIAVNLTGTYNAIRASLTGMLDRRQGRIVNIASTAALRGYAYVAAYTAAKHGILGLTRALALEYAQRGITVNAICPGYTDTDIVTRAIGKIQATTGRPESEARAELVKSNPQGRLIKPEEVAHAVAWLCLPGTESITGQAITLAGGEVM